MSSAEKTEKATSKKRSDARKEGQVLRSTDANTAFCCITMFSLLLILWRWYTESLLKVLNMYLDPEFIIVLSDEINVKTFSNILSNAMNSLLGVLLPILGTSMIAGFAINVLQTGFMFTTKTLAVKFNRISPISGFKRMFSIQSVVELLKSVIKILILGYIGYSDYRKMIVGFPELIGIDIFTAFINFMTSALKTALKMSAFMVAIAAADYLYQWWKYEKDLRMTKQEVKDEYKQMEGDPQIKGRIRSKQRQMSAMRMMSKVPEADVVITNPTHYAVALKYDDKVSKAPVVIAKGEDYLARKIKEVAKEHNIEIIENKPLAQALYAACEVDDEIPEEFYQAVADILVFVYKQKQKPK